MVGDRRTQEPPSHGQDPLVLTSSLGRVAIRSVRFLETAGYLVAHDARAREITSPTRILCLRRPKTSSPTRSRVVGGMAIRASSSPTALAAAGRSSATGAATCTALGDAGTAGSSVGRRSSNTRRSRGCSTNRATHTSRCEPTTGTPARPNGSRSISSRRLRPGGVGSRRSRTTAALRCARGAARRARQSEHLGEKLPPIPTGRSGEQGP